MNSYLLNLPLGVKIPVKTKSHPVFCRGKVGEKLNGPCPSFNLDDPYMYQPSLKYNCLHDPHLRDYHKRKDILRLLKRQGSVTRDNKVVCTLKEFNEYREYLTRIKLQSDKISGQKKAKLKDGPKLPGTTDTFCWAQRWTQPQKPSCSHPQKSKETPLKSQRFRREETALDEGQTYSRAQLGQEDASTAADSQRKPDSAADSHVKAVLEQLTTAEAQKLQELIETVVQEVFGRLRVPQDYYVSFLRRAARKIRGIVFGGCVRTETPLDHHQEMEMVAKELVATVLEILGNRLESKASESGRAARWKEQPVDGGATQADTFKEAQRAHLHACLDKLIRQVVKNVRCLLKSMVAFQFEGDSSCEYTKILKLPKGKVSNRQMQPGISGASEEQGQEESTGVKLPPLGPQVQAEGTGNAKPMEPEDPATVKESLVREKNPATLGNTLDIMTMANQIVQSLLDQTGQHGHAPAPRQNFQGSVPNPATSQGREESCAAENTLPSVDPSFSQQPVPPEGPKPSAQSEARRRSVHSQLV
ncbi:uncharacterized protein LOC111938377 isoform X1 [Cyanistes caeruleus]|uniref:uncharacterized protein LOC111938377 isoform X1 n=1 Tax=Cyanistes caeruleus TaxID=156563 RepID=UPI000CD9FF18|nr:uncharacterized protein LOC111938377 isoform X1 [Cyanistes caeruleus]XP_023795858.1 uncharacterized protein LOC111938377 isoform X1 [Cyanistes caeruleus]